jgi:hypothetical protein
MSRIPYVHDPNYYPQISGQSDYYTYSPYRTSTRLITSNYRANGGYMYDTVRNYAPYSGYNRALDATFNYVRHRKFNFAAFGYTHRLQFPPKYTWRNLEAYFEYGSGHQHSAHMQCFDYYSGSSGGYKLKPKFYKSDLSSLVYPKIKDMIRNDASLLDMQDVNILAFIGELKDVKRLIELFKFKNIDDKMVSDKFLGVEFGLLPFAGDIVKIRSAILDLPNKLGKWNDFAQREKIMNKHCVIEDIDNTITDETDYKIQTTVGYTKINYRAKMKGTEKIKVLGHVYFRPKPFAVSEIESLRASILGAGQIASALWQLLPFSFIVDWFLNVGDLIDRITSADPKLQLEVVSCGYSIRHKTEVQSDFYVTSILGEHKLHHIVDGYDSYERIPLSPTWLQEKSHWGVMRWEPNFDSFKGLLTSALVHQRLRS